jgi:hypothetical protein
MVNAIPAYGRDYTTAKAVKADWADGKDFRICDNFNPDDGRYVNRQDCKPGEKIRIRYKRLTEVVIFNNPKEKP